MTCRGGSSWGDRAGETGNGVEWGSTMGRLAISRDGQHGMRDGGGRGRLGNDLGRCFGMY